MALRWVTVDEVARAYGWSLAEAQRFVDGQRCPKVYRRQDTLVLVKVPASA